MDQTQCVHSEDIKNQNVVCQDILVGLAISKVKVWLIYKSLFLFLANRSKLEHYIRLAISISK